MKRIPALALAGALATFAPARAAEKKPVEDKRTPPQLVEALGGDLPYARHQAAKALGARGPKVLPVVLKALKHTDWRIRRGATDALAALGADANTAAAALAAALKDKNAWVRDGAASALGKLGRLPKPAAQALARAVTDPDPWVREAATEALRSATQDKTILLPAAVAAIRARHSGWNVRRHAVAILSRHGRQHKPAAAALIEMLEHPSQGMWDCSQQAVEILISLKAAKKAVPILARWLTSTNRGVSRRAAQALGKIGKDAAAAIPALREMAEKDPDRRNRDFARKVLEQIEAAGRDKTPGKKPN